MGGCDKQFEIGKVSKRSEKSKNPDRSGLAPRNDKVLSRNRGSSQWQDFCDGLVPMNRGLGTRRPRDCHVPSASSGQSITIRSISFGVCCFIFGR